MTYQPYPQQPYPPGQYQQPYPQYTYPQPYPVQGPPPSSGSKTILIIIVVVVILIILIPAILSFILITYMQSFSQGPGEITPMVTTRGEAFMNPYEGTGTTNGGGWKITIVATSGTTARLSNTNLKVTSGGMTKYSLSGVSTPTADLGYDGGTMSWYLEKGVSSAQSFMDGSTSKILSSSTAKDLSPGEFETVQGAVIIYIDNGKDGLVSTGDLIYVFSDINGDNNPEVHPGYELEIGDSTSTYGSATLI